MDGGLPGSSCRACAVLKVSMKLSRQSISGAHQLRFSLTIANFDLFKVSVVVRMQCSCPSNNGGQSRRQLDDIGNTRAAGITSPAQHLTPRHHHLPSTSNRPNVRYTTDSTSSIILEKLDSDTSLSHRHPIRSSPYCARQAPATPRS